MPKRPRCPRCTYWTYWGGYEEHVAMQRLYVKFRGSWKAVGWICPYCGHVMLTAKFPIREFMTAITTSRSEKPAS